MALASHPQRDLTQSEPRRGSIRTTVVDASPRQTIALRQIIDGLLWETNTKLLDLVEVYCSASGSELGWKRMKKSILDLVNEEQRQVRMAVNQIMSLGRDLEIPGDSDGKE
jgi:hypothetical protein